MLIESILEFNKRKYFGGAVQANWFYDDDMVNDIASNYVFHSSKYHGVNKDESIKDYKLYDTASYTLNLVKKSKEFESNRFNMTIAGYGTGKSHLSVALATLLSGHNTKNRDNVLESILSVDRKICEEIKSVLGKNLVIVLNGMNDFNLNSEFLSVTKKALKQHGLSVDILNELTKQYKIASDFAKINFESRKSEFINAMTNYGVNGVQNLNDIIELLSNANQNVFKAVNEVYYIANGTYINVEADITSSDILSLLVKKMCIEERIFDRIYILFDEFGRYIEFTANKPHIAGDASLQQIFEAIQNAGGYIIFDAFIQYELKAYIRVIEGGNANLKRYVDRYDNSDKYHLTSNSETVLANLIEKKDEANFDTIIAGNITGKYYGNL